MLIKFRLNPVLQLLCSHKTVARVEAWGGVDYLSRQRRAPVDYLSRQAAADSRALSLSSYLTNSQLAGKGSEIIESNLGADSGLWRSCGVQNAE